MHNYFQCLKIKGDVIGNETYTRPGYSVDQTRGQDNETSYRVTSVLNVTSFSLSAYLRSPFTCIGRVGNPVVERAIMRNVSDLRVQCKSHDTLAMCSFCATCIANLLVRNSSHILFLQ